MNEEDIKNIEYSLLINNGFNGMGLVDIPTLKKLYEKYKELEEENKNYKKYAVMMSTEGLIINGVKFSFNDYIPKSKVEKMIEEVNKSNGYSPVNKILIEQVLNSILYLK